MNHDYAACRNGTCRVRFTCYRFMMKRGDNQNFATFELKRLRLGEFCEGYSVVRPGDKLRDDAK